MTDHVIDVDDVAARVRLAGITAWELAALAKWLFDRGGAVPAISATFAVAVQQFIAAHDRLQANGIIPDDGGDYLTPSNDAFNALKTLFEKEFPHVGS